MFQRTRAFFRRRGSNLKDRTKTVVNWGEISEQGQRIQQTFETLTRPKVGREETFSNAYRRLGLDESKLAQSHRYHSFRFYVFSLFFTLALGVFLFSLVRGEWFTLAPSLGALILMGALAFQASFVLYQIERRSLVDVREWARHPGSWIPAPFQPRSSQSLRPQ
jgi:hypothetical protein